MIAITVILIAFFLSPIVYRRFYKPKRTSLPKTANDEGSYVELSFGETFYTLKEGKESSSVIVLVHGFSTSSE